MDIYLKRFPDYLCLVGLGICRHNFNEFFKVYETITWSANEKIKYLFSKNKKNKCKMWSEC